MKRSDRYDLHLVRGTLSLLLHRTPSGPAQRELRNTMGPGTQSLCGFEGSGMALGMG